MFQDCCIASHQRWSCKAEHLPVGEIPGHDCQDDPKWTKGDIALCRAAWCLLICQNAPALLSKIITVPGTFLYLCLCLADRLPHFQHGDARQISFILTQVASDVMEMGRTLGQRRLAPARKCLMSLLQY